jgi:hypothetical protein
VTVSFAMAGCLSTWNNWTKCSDTVYRGGFIKICREDYTLLKREPK